MPTLEHAAMHLLCVGSARRLIVPPAAGDGSAGGARMLTRGDLGAIVIDVDASDFTGESGEANLADVVWLARRAGEHDRLIHAARGTDAAAVLPARFGTLFVAEDSLWAVLERHAGAIRLFLDQAEGRDEWSVKIIGDPAAATRALTARIAKERGIDTGAGGARYLLMRKVEQDAAARSATFMAEQSAAALRTLATACADIRLGRSGKRQEDGTEIIASASLLAGRDQAERLARVVEDVRAAAALEGLSVTLTGPWPPYSFAPSLDGPGGPAGAGEPG